MAASPQAGRANWAIGAGLFALVLAAYFGTLACDFVGLDDGNHLVGNPLVLERDIVGAFTKVQAALWIPLTWLSFIVEYSIAGLQPWVYHLTNVLLHATNAVLVWRWLESATGRRAPSVAVAVCFAIHPLNVESVAWITERKNVLSTCFWLLSLIAWTRFARTDRRRDYVLSLLAAAAGLLSKPMVITLPATLLLLDLWPLGRLARCGWTRLLIEKVPFGILSVGVVVATIAGHASEGGLVSAGTLTLGDRLLNAAASYGLYVRQFFWPFDLAILVRHPQRIPLGESLIGIGLLLALSLVAWRVAKRQPAVAWGWAWYLCTLLPVSGIMQAGGEASADRFFYVPGLGILVAVAWSTAPVAAAWPRTARCTAAVLCAPWFALTIHQVSFWQNSLTLFDRTLEVNPRSHRGLLNAGFARARAGDHWGAIARYRSALEIKQADAETWANVGLSFLELGDVKRARYAFHRALAVDPQHPKAKEQMAALERLGVPAPR